MAMNCCVAPTATCGLAGVTAIDTRVALVTVKVAGPEIMLPSLAVTVVLPAAIEEANPLEPGALLTVATPALEELQVTREVIPCVVVSE